MFIGPEFSLVSSWLASEAGLPRANESGGHPVVGVVALRQLRPRPAGVRVRRALRDVSRQFVAPLDATLLVAARRVPPPWHGKASAIS